MHRDKHIGLEFSVVGTPAAAFFIAIIILQVRELAVIGIDNAEKALVLFFDQATKSIGPNAADAVALIKRVIAVKRDFARKIARASDLTEAIALQFAYAGHKSKSRLI